MADLTAIILTKNESKNISACLESIKNFANRIVVVDSGSTDDTVEIAKRFGADVYIHEYTYYAEQFNWGLENTNINTKWILRLDADERFTPELCNKLEYLLKEHASDNVNGVSMEAWLYFMGKRIEHGVRKKRKLMIFKYGIGKIEDRKRDAHSIISCGSTISIKERFIHYDYKGISDFISKYNYYATKELQDFLDVNDRNNIMINTDSMIQGQRKRKFGIYYKFPKFIRAKLWFILNYYFKLGFLDGKEGYIFHYYECYWYRYLVDSLIYENEYLHKEKTTI